jgi:wobble nucleotide-excising tRNase
VKQRLYEGQTLEFEGKQAEIEFLYATGHIEISFGVFNKVFDENEFWSDVEKGIIQL